MPPSIAHASSLQLPPGPWPTVYDALCARFPHVGASIWAERFARGLVCKAGGGALTIATPYRVGLEVRYWREVADETPVAGVEVIIHRDADWIVVDKPHFLPVAPTGAWVEQTLLRRLQRRLGIESLAPLHRIDRATAGLVMFSANPSSRAAYHELFRLRQIQKTYHALAPALTSQTLPLTRRSRLARAEPFFRVKEIVGEPNSETYIDVIGRTAASWHYELRPRTGHKHQLRVHMAALGVPIHGDSYYPTLAAHAADDFAKPLCLLAHSLCFIDPCNGAARSFTSSFSLVAT